MSTIKLPAVPQDDGFSGYLRQVWKFPMLSVDEEYMLARRYHEHDDTDAAHKLVTSHLRLVAKIAFGYRGYGLPMADLVAEGNTGLMRAVQKFDPERGFRLSTYAMWWIKAAVTEYILHSWSMVKLGTMAAQKKLFFSLRKAKKQLNIYDNGELSPEQADAVAEKLGVTGKEALEMNRRLAARDFSLNTPMPKDEGMEYLDTLSSDAPSPESIVADAEERVLHNDMLKSAMGELPEREREIIEARFLSDDPITLEKLGERFGVSRERVRQLEARAFKKIQESVLTQHAAA
ncbi:MULTISPECIES: RNA polymerase sigma factor RpoH [Thalassospira]|jgi:RNA polymerase sigma-32 factor|uniref:RNA polymerase sigma factor RpoH n=5 Tax=Thalassospira TaxID=168934 RepID=A0A154W3B1_9PROT|nr:MULTISPECIES: RNA polymerase sigma factor RpoH [Thalassospira]MBR9778961.1 RNA polymerase sigma factor RpoH [Rhodospirillales bacterium]UKV16546.1 RNA polymerase sigma factor RpoH [Thalassospiraceae bacterium SW-3-3]AJD52060.1 RNA polymerase factor sigma-32 [Thalassospira xiamenensis M-5 = DSM 17429]KZB53837.1 RNA polymerase subunit sigma-70 [Thalassospira xiamenensis]KZB68075.1 RNA polymerase subunit sigma-70 [Thalassospira lucentensis]|tara:strand:- start:4270 stop:5139 length:870 start_codon:yes stop_codon:yes gene_type:complete|eukprot:TRINITY_DN13427_c0_g4_i1.p1 TRINITY_DN13427_c0_g4~~TRINITY_DN13427_c0_g4_i1.p1  ORF type:complete len:290 (-),score=34.34 TRINITY_DN13427_c0_g4_i1:613-1482(-)